MTEISKSHMLTAKSSPMMAELQEQELERQLGLFQVFRKLYEHHSSLLDEILQLENLEQRSLMGVKSHYVQGVVDASMVYVVTNLCENRTLRLQQPQGIWTIGRDGNSGICVADKYLSDRHAAIQYIENQGFYLFDFNSANGSFVNGEPVYQPIKLKDGDRIQLGSMRFNFFVNHIGRTLPTVAIELLMQLVPQMDTNLVKMPNSQNEQQKHLTQNLNDSLEMARESGLIEETVHEYSSLSAEEKSEILDRLFSRQKL